MTGGRDIPVIFSTGSLHTFGLDRVFGWISETGFDGVEVMMDDRWDTHQGPYLDLLRDRYDVPILALHPPIYQGAWRLPSGDTLIRSARLAATLEIPTVVAHPPRPGKALEDWTAGPLREARDTGVRIAVENMPKSDRRGFLGMGRTGSTYLPSHLDGFREITLDTSHVAASSLDLMDFYGRVSGRLSHVHLSDSKLGGGDEHRLPGRGKLPLKSLLASLANDGYPGAVSLELKPFQCGAPHPDKVLQKMSEAVAYAREGLVQTVSGP